MKLPSQKKIMREDLKDAPDWVTGITDPVNSFMENIYLMVNKNITFEENVNAFYRELEYKTVSTYPTNQPVATFENQLKTKLKGVTLCQAYDKINYTPAPGPVYIPWIEVNGTISISTVLGLEADKTYMIRLLVF